jgi:hypothetical protein
MAGIYGFLFLCIIIFLKVSNTKTFELQNYFAPNFPVNGVNPIKTELLKAVGTIVNYAVKNSNETIKNEFMNNQQCMSILMQFYYSDDNLNEMMSIVLSNSGKSLSDVGLQDDCVWTFNYTYFFITFSIKEDYDDPNFNLYKFLDQNKFFLGICMVSECTEIISRILDKSVNHLFFQHIERTSTINGLTIYGTDYQKSSFLIRQSSNSRIEFYTVILWIITIYILVRLFISLVEFLLFQLKSVDSNTKDFEENSFRSDSCSITYFENSVSKLNLLNNSQVKKSITGKFEKFLTIFSLTNNIYEFFKKKSRYYNETNLEILSGIRFILFICMTLIQNFYGIALLPHRNSSSSEFYYSPMFIMIKLCANIVQFYPCINGIYFGFKLMSYIKRNGNQFGIFDIIKFFVKLLPGFLVFFISFSAYHLFIKELGILLNNEIIFDYFVESEVNTKACVKDPLSIFKPFYLSYFKIGSDECFTDCFRWVYFIISEFYCYIFILILVYLLLKIRSSKLDLFFYFLNMINLSLCYFSYNHDLQNERYYTINNLIGETLTFKYPHLFFIPYFLGFNTGILYFYFKDLNSSSPVSDHSYNLFSFNFEIVKFLDKLNMGLKLFLLIFSIICFLLISFSFNFILIFQQGGQKKNILIKGSFITDLIFIYEGKVFSLFFLMFLSVLLILPKDNYIVNTLSSKIFTHINRINLAYFVFSDYITDVLYAFYNIQIFLNFSNVFYMSSAVLTFLIVYSILIVILYDLPYRMIIKDCFRKKNLSDRRKLETY